MVNTDRDSNGRIRIAKGDKSGYGGQFTYDKKWAEARIHALHNIETDLPVKPVETPAHLSSIVSYIAQDYINQQSTSKTTENSERLYKALLKEDGEYRAKLLKVMEPEVKEFWLAHLTDGQKNRIHVAELIPDGFRDSSITNYLGASIWTDVEPEDNEKGYTIYDIHAESRLKAEEDFDRFIINNPELVAEALNRDGYDLETFGHDIWLTRTHQGVGFWDRVELKENRLGDKLTEAVNQTLPAVSLIIGDDGKLHFE
jgi:hypothetical protein